MKTYDAPVLFTPTALASLIGFVLLGLIPTLIAGSMLAGGSL